MQDTANLALEDVVKSFSTAHQDAGVVSIPFATIQRGFVSNYGQLGFVNAESGCASDLAISQYSTGNLFSLADPTFTAEGAKVSRPPQNTWLSWKLLTCVQDEQPAHACLCGSGLLLMLLPCRPRSRYRPSSPRSSTSWEAICMERMASRTHPGQLQTSSSGSRASLNVRQLPEHNHGQPFGAQHCCDGRQSI